MNTGQTVYEQLQEIYEKIADKNTIDTQKEKLYQVFKGRYNCSRVREARQYNTMSRDDFSPLEEDEEIYDEVLNIFGGISLSRVLSALGEWFQYYHGHIMEFGTESGMSCKRKLLNKDGNDAMLDDQSDETIEALHKLLVRK